MPRIAGEIERRVLVNLRLDPEVAARALPGPFRPQVVDGHAIAGLCLIRLCLIRLGGIRPSGLPGRRGLCSESAAHRFSVEWDEPDGSVRTGVYIPRRDSNSWATVLLGGRLFPGVHHHARFDVEESPEQLRVGFTADDGSAYAAVEVEVAADLGSEVFGTLDEASRFFEQGARGFSPARRSGRLESLELETSSWRVEPVRVESLRTSYFSDTSLFPPGTVELDHALLMRKVPVTWQAGRP